MKDLISVIILVDETVESYINVCLDSVVKQTYNNLDIVIVTDNPTESTMKICKYYKKTDSRINIVSSKNENKKNVGIKNSKGKYITFIYAWDHVDVNFIQYMYGLIKSEKADMICISCDIKGNKTLTKEDILSAYLEMKVRSHYYAKLYKKELFENLKYPNFEIYDDFAITYKLFDASEKVVLSSSRMYNLDYRINKDKKTDLDHMKKINYAFDMLSFMDTVYPELVDITKVKIFYEALDLFGKIKMKELRKRLYGYIKIFRKYAMKSDLSIQKKMLCMRTVLGFCMMNFLYKVEGELKKPI